ncbi:carbon-nitrogen hydrolase [Triangularia verruculosa]|uniref:Carbon-nitrogen hydrolase n=1 Tax=Triangularia verruculosa TaxID=2587418 RepID=A0AAN6XQD4_9PEZI|nr:carbon-nitrogen hydrolase [Triangularia verruculosa]
MRTSPTLGVLRILTSSLAHPSTRPISRAQIPLPSLFRKMSTPAPPPAQTTPGTTLLRQPVTLACVQLPSTASKSTNLSHAASAVSSAVKSTKAKIVVLPECFNSPYGTDHFPSYAEPLPSDPANPSPELNPSFLALQKIARENEVYLIGGSIPELVVSESDPSSKKYYNTSLIFGPGGKLLATHRKVHLFDIDIPDKIKFTESDILSPGNKLTVIDLPEYGKIAVAICYDIRFPELAIIAARKGCFALIYPGAFNLTTGPLHWKLLGQARAVDNQLYVALCSPARDITEGVYHAYGHSLIVDPMAQVLAEAGEGEQVVSALLDGSKIEEARKGIPLRDQRRFDVYPDVSEGKVSYEE